MNAAKGCACMHACQRNQVCGNSGREGALYLQCVWQDISLEAMPLEDCTPKHLGGTSTPPPPQGIKGNAPHTGKQWRRGNPMPHHTDTPYLSHVSNPTPKIPVLGT